MRPIKAQYKDTKGNVLTYLDSNSDGFNIDKGVGFKCDYGSVTFAGREKINVNPDALAKLIEDGEITIHQVLACLSSDAFKKDETVATLAGHFDKVVTITETEGLTFRATSEFKEKCAAEVEAPSLEKGALLSELVEKHDKKSKPEPKVEAKPKAKTLSPAEKAKAAKARVSKVESPDDDLDAILKGGK